MIINSNIIKQIKTSNSQVSELLEKLNSFTEEDILELDRKLKEIKAKEKTVEEIVPSVSFKEIESSISTTNDFLFNSSKKFLASVKKDSEIKRKLLTGLSSKKEIPKILLTPKKKSQSSEKFSVERNIEEEKYVVLKSIDSKLLFKPTEPKEEKEKDNSDSLFKSILSSLGMFSGGLGLSKWLKKIPLKGVGKFATKGFGLLNSILSIKNLIGTIKTGFKEYKGLKKAGDSVGASNALLKALVMGSGNIMNIVGGFVPGPIGFLLMGAGTLLEGMAGEFDSIWSDKNNKQIQDQMKIANINNMLDTGKTKKNQEILQLRNSDDFTVWEYKDYNTGKWTPLIDEKTGNPLSILSGKNKIRPKQKSEDGIQRYQLETGKSGLVDIIMKNGRPQMMVNDKPTVISTRATGGPVKKGNKYLIGENGPEAYVPSNNELRRILNAYNNTLIESNKKMVRDFEIANKQIKQIKFPELDITVPTYTITDLRYDTRLINTRMLDKVSTQNTLPSIPVKDTSGMVADLSKARIADDVKKALMSIPANSRNYAIKIASIESSYNAKAKAGTSSASGIFQFTADTWKDAIRFSSNPEHKKYNMDDRFNPQKSAELFPVFFAHREKVLKQVVASPSDTDYYLAHFMGPGGAVKFLKGYYEDPSKEAYKYVAPKQVNANKSIFFKNGDKNKPYTLQEVYTNFSNKLNSRYSEFGVNFVPVLDVGTDRVKKSGPALLHEGEIVIPANKANKIRTLSNSSSLTPIREQKSVKSIEEEFMINTIVKAMAESVKKEYGLE